MIVSIKPVNLVHVTMSEEYAEKCGFDTWKEFRTNQQGTYWENLMGESWEQIDPPQEFIDEYKRLYGVI